ncbi:MAG: hypothetical protein ACI8S6_003641 [Myxococcota bacterium]|jgi:hypothetical protein
MLFIGLSVLVHLTAILVVSPYWGALTYIDPKPGRSLPVTLLIQPPEPEDLTEPEEEEPEYRGQIVDTPPDPEEEEPEESDYLAETNRIVEQETRTQEYRINPEVLSERFSPDDQLQFEDVEDLNITEPSTGAQVGNDRFDPSENGRLANLPSPFTRTNKDGLQSPTVASSTEASRAGAPNNDLLNEDISDAVRLNTREFLYAGYINRIRRLVSFYWKQNVDNIPRSEPLIKPQYTTVVNVILDSSGSLESIELSTESGSAVVDNCIVDAFRIAGPFPNPPESLIAKDGRVYLPEFGFTLEVGAGRAPFIGVDPRSGVRFPGILKANQ